MSELGHHGENKNTQDLKQEQRGFACRNREILKEADWDGYEKTNVGMVVKKRRKRG